MSGNQQHQTIYAGANRDHFYTPFHLRVDPMERLLLINWRKGQYYKGAEPQWFDDEQHGRGLLVILYRIDDKVDVYHQPTLTLDPAAYQIQSGLGQMVACHFERSHFQIRPQGVDADIAFTDHAGRPIVLRIREDHATRAGSFSLLAPMGHTIKEPDALPLFFLYDFSFVKVGGSEVTVTVDGAPRELVKLPVPMGGSRVYLTRYCGDPFIAFWNPQTSGPLTGSPVTGHEQPTVDGVRYALVRNAGHYEIAAMARGLETAGSRPARELQVTFDPPFPALTALRDGVSVAGAFRAKMAPIPDAGDVGGEWQVARHGHQVQVRLRPSAGWQPGEPALTPRLIFTIVRPFKQWPKSYEWTAAIDLSRADAPTITSTWQRL